MLLRDPDMSLRRLAKLLTQQLVRNEIARQHRWRVLGRPAPPPGLSRNPFRLVCRMQSAQ